MGQYLAMGIMTRVATSKEKANKEHIQLETVLQKMQQTFHFAPELYDFTDHANYWVWELKKDIWEPELSSFLKEVYPLLYAQQSSTDCDDVLEKLSSTPASSWLQIAKEKSFEAFQFDEYGEGEYLHFKELTFQPTLKVSVESVALAMEGKIVMEVYGQLFHFFQYCFQKTFSSFQLSKAIRLYITG